MEMRRMLRQEFTPLGYLVLACLALVPDTASAQSGIVGSVRDTSGAVLPGVTVEASSPVLIEKIRAVSTDAAGLYQILDLRPGVYTVTFSLPGFATIRRERFTLPADFTATLNTDMSVSGVEETVTVTGAAPVVDVARTVQQTVLSRKDMEGIPITSRSPQAYAILTPGVTNIRFGAAPNSVTELSVSIHGSRPGESLILLDGDKAVEASGIGGGSQVLRWNQAYIEEISVVTGAASAEQETSGMLTNIIPREGGNRLSGFFFTSFTNNRLQGNNLSDDLRAVGLVDFSGINRNYDVTAGIGGPLAGDKLWFYSSVRAAESDQTIAGRYYDLDPSDWVYTPDLSRPASEQVLFPDANSRFTWQATQRNKIGFFVQRSGYLQVGRGSLRELVSPEAARYTTYVPNVFGQIIWKSTFASRLLLDASYSSYYLARDQRTDEDRVGPGVIPARDVAGAFPGFAFRSPPSATIDYFLNKDWNYKANATYVTGSHALKVGLAVRYAWDFFRAQPFPMDMMFNLRDGVPISLQQDATPWERTTEMKPNLGLFAQDQWRIQRLTLNAGLRFDYFRANALGGHLPATRWVAARDLSGVKDVPRWKDISPRFGAAYDLFGQGKTALKFALNRYVNGEGTGLARTNHLVNRSVLSVTRNWTDTNRNFVPDCDLHNPLANGREDLCGQISNLNFGQNNPNAATFADDVLHGFAVRPYNWNTAAEVQHQLFTGTSVSVGYYRRWFGNFRVTDNVQVTPADHDPFCITAPVDSRLPQGGGYQVCGLADVKREKFGQVTTHTVQAENYGKQTEIYDGFDLTTNARFPNGARISGGMNFGRTATNRCFVVDSPQELLNCDVKPKFQPTSKMFAIYPLPVWGLQVSAVLQVIPGPEITASYVARNAEVVPTLGRDLASGAGGSVTVPLIKPGTLYADRSTQLDVRFTKRFNVAGTSVEGTVDIFNVLNGSGVQSHNNNFGGGWLRPSLVQLPRYVMFTFQLNL